MYNLDEKTNLLHVGKQGNWLHIDQVFGGPDFKSKQARS